VRAVKEVNTKKFVTRYLQMLRKARVT